MTGEYELDKPELRVGRIAANDIRVPAGRVSRLHAKIRWGNGGWLIEDAQSLNGLSYRGELTDSHRLSDGDRIYLAPTAVLIYKEEKVPVGVSPRPSKPESPALRMYPSQGQLAPIRPPSSQAQIVVEVDGRVLMTRSLDRETLMVGRLPANDVQISSTLVSGQHAMLIRQDGKWMIIDRGSRNGLTYQGQRVERHMLSKGDRIYLAPTVVLRFE
jgi:pSer/pThr/pTyr-binding forkhead associated (FHA) protein